MTNARAAKSTREKAAELRAEAAKAEARRRTVMITGAVAVVVAILVAGVVLIKTASDNAKARDVAAAAPPANLYENGMLYGNSTAKVTVELFEDFICPACKQAEEANGAQLDAWVKAGTVKVVYKPVSILDRFSSTEYSTRAANAAAVVQTQSPSAFLAFHKALFDQQPPENGPGLTDDQLIEIAVSAGADKAKIEADIRGQRYKLWVVSTSDAFSQRFAKEGNVGTPTIAVNGTKLADSSPDRLKAAVEAATAAK